MTIAQLIAARNITEVLHFTTNTGVLGILDTGYLKARARLNVDERLEHIFTPNSQNRTRDQKYLDYVNLSISRINTFFAKSSGNWHRDTGIWWCILSFSPEILTHDDVIFTTTNNIYTSVNRQGGRDGLEKMFALEIEQYSQKKVIRPFDFSANWTTCVQAEALYLGQVSTQFLNKVYAPTYEIADQIAGQLNAVQHRAIEIEVREHLFTELN
jgi:hypothetical protein